jgi:hypothetical protein
MKHIKTFEGFLGENLNEVKLNFPDIVIPANDADDLDEEAVYFKDILKKAGVKAKCKTGLGEIEIYLDNKSDLKKAQKTIEKNGYTYEGFLNEGNTSGLEYWKQYTEDPDNFSPSWYNKNAKTESEVEELVNRVIDQELADSGDKDAFIKDADEEKLKDLAMDYFKKFGSINGNIISAMFSQESLTESVNSSPKNFLRALNYQPFDDWYKKYNRFVEGDLEPGDSGWNGFIKETESIMKFLEKALQTSK